jgi:hypothetical protein
MMFSSFEIEVLMIKTLEYGLIFMLLCYRIETNRFSQQWNIIFQKAFVVYSLEYIEQNKKKHIRIILMLFVQSSFYRVFGSIFHLFFIDFAIKKNFKYVKNIICRSKFYLTIAKKVFSNFELPAHQIPTKWWKGWHLYFRHFEMK